MGISHQRCPGTQPNEFRAQKSVDDGSAALYVSSMETMPRRREMDRASFVRDKAYDGIFIVAVRTTGIFCRPSCPAKKPLPKNVEYFATPRDAILAGYRPCKRCRPMDLNGRQPDWVRRLLLSVDANPRERLTDADLRARSIDPAAARRFFRSHYGMTFQAYHRMQRMGHALTELKNGAGLLDVAFDHGFDSSSGFRDAFARVFGEAPGRGRGVECIVTTSYPSPLGRLVAAATEDGVCLLEFADRRALQTELAILRRRLNRAFVPGRNQYLEQLADELRGYFDGTLQRFTVPLLTPGTPFQEAVWERLRAIPYGETMSYEGMAKAIGHARAVRAVGGANGANRIAIVIPCHRVVQKDGQLRGYGGGLWRKKYLLEHEAAVLSSEREPVAAKTG